MKRLVFDTGPLISLTTNNLLWILEPLKDHFKGLFCITESVRQELIDRPLASKKFRFEALQVEALVEKGIIDVVSGLDINSRAMELLNVANSCFYARNTSLRIVQLGEMESFAYASLVQASAFVVDERITRMLLEEPSALRKILEKRLHSPVQANKQNISRLSAARNFPMIRSAELVTIAFELGLLDDYILRLPDAKRQLLSSVLWGVKLNGCALSEDEITQIMKLELRQ